MMMEMFLNEQKAKDNNINIDECYLQVDNFFEKHGVIKLEKGVYKGNSDTLHAWLKCSGIYHKHPGF